jgi:hypothetical protein
MTEPWCWLCSYPAEPCPWNCFELEGRIDEQLDLFEDDAEDSN